MKLLHWTKKFILIGFVWIVYLLLFTSIGLRSTIASIKLFIPGELRIQQISGSLLTAIHLRDIYYKNDNIKLTVHDFNLSWNPYALLERKIDIKFIYADNIDIEPGSHAKTDYSFPKAVPAWLKAVSLKGFLLTRLRYQAVQQRPIIFYSLYVMQNKKYADFFVYSSSGRFAGQARISVDHFLSWKTQLRVEKLNLQAIYPDQQSLIDFNINSEGTLNKDDNHFYVTLTEVKGQLQNIPVHGFVSVNYNNGNIQVKKSYLSILNADFKMTGVMDDQVKLDWQIHIPNLNLFSTSLNGTFSAKGTLKGYTTRPQLDFFANMNHLQVQHLLLEKLTINGYSDLKNQTVKMSADVKNISYQNVKLPHLDSKISLKSAQKKWQGSALILANTNNQLKIDFSFPKWTGLSYSQQALSVNMLMNLQHPEHILTLPGIKNMRGTLLASAEMTGKIMDPLINMNLKILNARFIIPSAYVNIKQFFLSAEYQTHHPLYFKGSFLLGTGNGKLSGKVEIEKPGLPFSSQIDGEMLEWQKDNEYKLRFSPQLQVTYRSPVMAIRGNVIVDNAILTPHDSSTMTTLPSEAVIVDQKKPQNTAFMPDVLLNIALDFKQIKFIYQNINAKLQGHLQVSQTIGSLPKGVGTLVVTKGYYKMYDRTLTLHQGRVIYMGNLLTNPELDVRATRRIEKAAFNEEQSQFHDKLLPAVYAGTSELIVGVWLKGPLSQPRLTFFSEPAGTSQNDILSYLAFDRPRAALDISNSLAILNGIASIHSTSSKTPMEQVMKKIENNLSLTELNVGSTDVYDSDKNTHTQVTTLNIGRQLSKNLSVRYRTGLFTSVSILNLQYKINRQFSIQTETSNLESGADLLYQIETD